MRCLIRAVGIGTRGNLTYLARGIDYLAVVFSAIVFDAPPKGAFDGWVVVFDELVFKVLNDKGRFS
jgi:hypothetical protein